MDLGPLHLGTLNMPITEIVRVLASGTAGDLRVELFYDVDGRMGPDEDAKSRPFFWLRLGSADGSPHVLGPFGDEPEAMDRADALGVIWD
jgi:hypothetical protein